MANSSRGDQHANRTIIIPKGVLNPDQLNVINIPRRLNTSAPLLVTPRREGGLKSQTLPIWNDELSSAGKRAVHANLEVKPKACSSRKGDDSTFSSAYDSSAGIEENPADFMQGQYNIAKPMPPWPEQREGEAFMPRFMSSQPEGIDRRFLNKNSSLPSSMYTQDFLDPDLPGMYDPSATATSSGVDLDCVCPSGDVNATQQEPYARFNQQNPNLTYDQSPRFNPTFAQPQNPSYNQPQNFDGMMEQYDDSFEDPDEIDQDCICPTNGGDGADFDQRQNMSEYGGQFSQYQQHSFYEEPDNAYPSDTSDEPFEEQYQPYPEDETYRSQPSNQTSEDAPFYQQSSYMTPRASPRNESAYQTPRGPSQSMYNTPTRSLVRRDQTNTPGEAPTLKYQACSNMDEEPYAPRVVHMSSRTFVRVNDDPPESRSITIDAPDGVDEPSLRYVTQMATFGDSGPRTDDSYFADQSYSSPTSLSARRQLQSSQMGRWPNEYAQQSGFEGSDAPECHPTCYSTCSPSR